MDAWTGQGPARARAAAPLVSRQGQRGQARGGRCWPARDADWPFMPRCAIRPVRWQFLLAITAAIVNVSFSCG